MKLGFIGYGNMATAIIAGILKQNLVAPEDIFVVERLPEKQAAAQKLGLQIAEIEKTKNIVNMIFICVKPQGFASLLSRIKTQKNNDITYVSIAAGITIDYMATILGERANIVRVMPNTPMLLGKGTSALCRSRHVPDESYVLVKKVFASAGTVYDIPEPLFNEILNLNGSAPAYIFLFAKTIAEHAHAQGIEYDTAIHMIGDTLHGAAEMLLHSGKTAGELIQNVSSPGGTTVAALEAMTENGFISSLQLGCDACVKRAEELGNR